MGHTFVRTLVPLSSAIAVISSTIIAAGCLGAVEDQRSSSNEIIHGTIAEEGEYPTVVGVIISDGRACTGTLISPTTVLSAAHCFVHPPEPTVDPSRFSVSTKLDVTGKTVGEYRVKTIKWPDTWWFFPGFDIALVELVKPIPGGHALQPLAVTPPDFTDDSYRAVGYGLTSGESDHQSLTWGDLGKVIKPLPKESYFEASPGAQPICFGDSGGPLMTSSDLMQIGVSATFATNGGLQGAAACEIERYAGYTRVDGYAGWIRQNVGDLPITESATVAPSEWKHFGPYNGGDISITMTGSGAAGLYIGDGAQQTDTVTCQYDRSTRAFQTCNLAGNGPFYVSVLGSDKPTDFHLVISHLPQACDSTYGDVGELPADQIQVAQHGIFSPSDYVFQSREMMLSSVDNPATIDNLATFNISVPNYFDTLCNGSLSIGKSRVPPTINGITDLSDYTPCAVTVKVMTHSHDPLDGEYSSISGDITIERLSSGYYVANIKGLVLENGRGQCTMKIDHLSFSSDVMVMKK